MKDDFDGSIDMTLHLLRKPTGWDPDVLRRAHILAAAIIEEALIEIETQISRRRGAVKNMNRYAAALTNIAEGIDPAGLYPCRHGPCAVRTIARDALRDDQ